jgi:hypothetical protein
VGRGRQPRRLVILPGFLLSGLAMRDPRLSYRAWLSLTVQAGKAVCPYGCIAGGDPHDLGRSSCRRF